MLRISATLLEGFRLYLEERFEQAESSLLATIRREQVETPNMRIGKAVHALLEQPRLSTADRDYYEHDGLLIERDVIDSVRERVHPEGVYETKVAKEIEVAGMQVSLVSKADHIHGLHISEFKAPLDCYSLDTEKYLASYQWRTMCLLYGASVVTYIVVSLQQLDDVAHDDVAQMPCFGLRFVDWMNVYPYASMEQDIRWMIGELIRYVRAMKLEPFLEWQNKAVVA